MDFHTISYSYADIFNEEIIMSKSVKWILGIVFFIGLFIYIYVSTYNSIVRLDENVTTQHANISVQLERRADLIPNLLSTVKAYASHETEIFENLAKSREKLLAASSIDEQAEADAQMTSALGRLFAISEAYPDLKANTNFIRLQDELAGTENRIAVSRRDYNMAVQMYNSAIRVFPGVLIANFTGFTSAKHFEAREGVEAVPAINFDL